MRRCPVFPSSQQEFFWKVIASFSPCTTLTFSADILLLLWQIPAGTKLDLNFTLSSISSSVKSMELSGIDIPAISDDAHSNSKMTYFSEVLNSRLNQKFGDVYKRLCEISNSVTLSFVAQAHTNPTAAVRALTGKCNIVAYWQGEVLSIHGCIPVKVDKIYADGRLHGKCYSSLPVSVNNRTLFVADGTRDLVQMGTVVDCDSSQNPIRLVNGSYQNSLGPVVVHKTAPMMSQAEFEPLDSLIFRSAKYFTDSSDRRLEQRLALVEHTI